MIALFVFTIAYVVAAIVFCLTATLSRRSVAKDLKAIIPVSLTTPLGVILGLLIAFHASRVWTISIMLLSMSARRLAH